ncbi:MAG: glycerol-3-phosphate 1-O-acyltransferase PlsY [Legionella sp.]|nr:glycerol-3-phosphate 1-O-acyltransferase PlsY [Legionella sp.]
MIISTFLIILAYVCGSICSAVIVSQIFSLPDPRIEGSTNPGATNVLRLAGKKYALIVLATDILKGLVPVLIAKLYSNDPSFVGYVALAAVLGHVFPVFFNFKGGKGVATAIGALLGFQFLVGVMVVGTWLIVARIWRYSSLASLISISLAPIYGLMVIGRIEIFPPLFFIALLIIINHKDNISRLIEGTESKIKFKQNNVLDEVLEEDPGASPMPVVEERHTPAANENIPATLSAIHSKPIKTTVTETSKKKITDVNLDKEKTPAKKRTPRKKVSETAAAAPKKDTRAPRKAPAKPKQTKAEPKKPASTDKE